MLLVSLPKKKKKKKNVASIHLVWRNDPDFSISLLSPSHAVQCGKGCNSELMTLLSLDHSAPKLP